MSKTRDVRISTQAGVVYGGLIDPQQIYLAPLFLCPEVSRFLTVFLRTSAPGDTYRPEVPHTTILLVLENILGKNPECHICHIKGSSIHTFEAC